MQRSRVRSASPSSSGFLVARFRLGMNHYLLAVLIVLWFSVGGHFVEIFFLNWMRERIPSAAPQLGDTGAVVLVRRWRAARPLGMAWTASVGDATARGDSVARVRRRRHFWPSSSRTARYLRGRPSFYNGLA